MRKIPDKYKDAPEAKALQEARATFEEAAQALLAANRASRATGYDSLDELMKAQKALSETELRMKEAEAAFELVTGGPDPVPLTDAVISKVKLLFPEDQQAEITRLLEKECANLPLIGTAEGLERIRLDVLKIANGDLSELREQVRAAKFDWRDVINEAEYPEATNFGFAEYDELDKKAQQEIEERDREQYLAWLNEGKTNGPSQGIWNRIWPWPRSK